MSQPNILFRWLDPSWEIQPCTQGNCVMDKNIFIPIKSLGNQLSNLTQQQFQQLNKQKGFNITARFTRALYKLQSSNAQNQNMTVKQYLDPAMGKGGQYSGWLQFYNTSLKANLLHCTQDHKSTFGQNRTIGFFLFNNCTPNSGANFPCPFPFNMRFTKAVNNFNVNQPFPYRVIEPNISLDSVIRPERGVIKYAQLGSLMTHGYTNNCEIDFVGDVMIPIILIQLQNNHGIPLPEYMLYDLIMEHAALSVYNDAYSPFETMTGGKTKKKKRKSNKRKKKSNKRKSKTLKNKKKKTRKRRKTRKLRKKNKKKKKIKKNQSSKKLRKKTNKKRHRTLHKKRQKYTKK